MNEKTLTPIKAVIAIYAMPRYTRQQKQEKQQHEQPAKEFDNVLNETVKPDDNRLEYIPTGCYSKDARQVVGNVSHFHAAS